MNTEKECVKCKTVQPIDHFSMDRRKSDGHMTWCKSCMRIVSAEWHKNNKTKVRAYYGDPQIKLKRRDWKLQYDRKLRKNPLHRLGNNIRANMRLALKAKKAGRKWEDLVGYTLQDLINHVDPLLTNGMTWDNYGTQWHLDHITPKSWFKYDSTDHPAFMECWSLSNLQPKWKMDNIRKGNRFKG